MLLLNTNEYIKALDSLQIENMYNSDFLQSWDKTNDEIKAVFAVADALKDLRVNNISSKVFDSGLGISLFRDNSTRTRISFAGACDLLGLTVQDLDEGKSQIVHGETLRETANMISYMAEVIGIRDDIYLGKGSAGMREIASALTEGFEQGVLERRPSLVNLQDDVDHPTQSMGDMLHMIHHFGGIENLRGKKLAITWAHTPSYGKPLSVPQGIIGLMSRMGMDVVFAHPEGYDLAWEVEKLAGENADRLGGSFTRVGSMAEAYEGADIVFSKNWAPVASLGRQAKLYDAGKLDEIKALKQEQLAENAKHKDWVCDEKLMKTTKDGDALYMHCLPADISGFNCEDGEVTLPVFDKHRIQLYKQAGHKPYIIAAMIFLSRCKSPQRTLADLAARNYPRVF